VAKSPGGRIWLVVGIALGIAVGLGKLAYFAGAARSLTDTAERVVGTAGLTLIHSAARHGAPQRVVEGLAGVLAVIIPGITALCLIIAARATLRIRALVGLLVAALGVAAFFYQPHGIAIGTAVLALAVAAIAVALTGPLVAAPLAAFAALIATVFLPRLLASHSTIPNGPVLMLHSALFGSAGSPLWLRLVVLVIAAVPFGVAARLVAK
jgi:hypothetical protein